MKEQFIYIDTHGNKFYFSDKEMTIRHREDGPAVEYVNGDKSWWIGGKCHREDGPAVEYSHYKVWCRNGLRHREDGPAIEYVNGGYKYWFIDDKQLTEKEFKATMDKPVTCEGKIVEVDGKKYRLTSV